MATIKGLTIEIGGETGPLEKALSGVNKTSRDLQNELREVEKLLKLDPTNTDLLAQKQKILGDAVSTAAQKLDTLKTAAEQAAAKLASGEVGEEQYRALQREVIKAEQNLNSLEKQANGTGDKLDKAGKQAKQSGDDAEKGKSGWDNLGTGVTKAGEIAGKAVLALGTAVVAAGAGVVAIGSKAVESADNLQTLSDQTGFTTEQLQIMQYQGDDLGVSLDTMTSVQSKLIKNMDSAKSGTGTAAAAFKELGISVTDANGNLRDSNDVYGEALDALSKVTNETERTALAQKIFGKSAAELNPLLKAGSAGLEELEKQAIATGAIMSDETVAALDGLGDSVDHLKTTVTSIVGTFVAQFAPAIQDVASSLAGLLAGTVSTDEFIGKVSALVTQAATAITQMLPTLIATGGQILLSLVNGIVAALPQIVPAVVQVITSLVTQLIQMLPMLYDAAAKILVALALGIAQALPTLIPTIVDTMIAIVNTLIDNLGLLIDAAIQIIIALALGLINALPKLIEKVPEILIKLVTAIIKNLPLLIEAAIQIVVMLARAIIDNLGKLLEVAGKIISKIGEGLKNTWNDIVSVGKNIVEGIWEGIKGAGEWLWNQIKGFFSDTIDAVKDFLGIASPSKVFAGIGSFMAEGLGVGFTDSMTGIARDMQKAIPTDFEGSLSYAVSPSYAAAGAEELSMQDTVGSALLAGLYAIGDAIFDAIPKSSVLSVNGKELVSATWDDAEYVAQSKGKIYAASRDAIANIARTAVKKKP